MQEKPVQTDKAKDEQTMWMALGLVWEIGYLIAIPAVLFGFGGGYLDKYYGTSPLLVILGLLLALVVSGLAVYRRVKAVTSRL